MLIALEIAGFKSFADKTRFEFPDGITVVVGPNGSGKSNVVDAIKWVLGAQSAKALRGHEMADVIFKGASGTGRKPANSAEATLFFDNANRNLAIDADLIQVTRRVYRSGDSEYLINQQVARLKDIKSLFRGTGVGVDAYSIIEQGKVDRLLQASPKDRRIIFEEAAGISRFNAKKIEAERRMLRVDQNLVRLKDIVDEVRSRLNTIKNQAGKAQKYREMTNRLHTLRMRLGWTEYCELLERQNASQERLEKTRQEQLVQGAEWEQAKARAQSAEGQLHQVAEEIQRVETLLHEAEQRIAVADSQRQSYLQRIEETDAESQEKLQRMELLRTRLDEVALEVETARSEMAAAANDQASAHQHAQASEGNVRRLTDELKHYSNLHEELRTQHGQLWCQATEHTSEIKQLTHSLNELLQSIELTEASLIETNNSQQSTRQLAERSAARLEEIHDQHQQASKQLEIAKSHLEEYRGLLSRHQEEAGVLQGRLEGASERLDILEELKQHLEGVDAGARYVLNQKAAGSDPAFASVYGLVADIIQVDVLLAPMIDTALGNAANALVLKNGQLIQLARTGQLQVPGRLTLMRLDRVPATSFGEKVQLDGLSGVIGRADRLVKCRKEVFPLVRYLLGTTWLVESLEVALELGHFRGAGLRFVTADCQMIEADGTLTLGSLTVSSGLVSRGSEIRSAKDEIGQCKLRFQKLQGEIERVNSRITSLHPSVAQLELQVKGLAQELSHYQAAAQSAASKLDELERQALKEQRLLDELRHRQVTVGPQMEQAQARLSALRERIENIESQLESCSQTRRGLELELASASQEQVNARVRLAKSEQRLEVAKLNSEQSERNFQERHRSFLELEQEIERLASRKQQTQTAIEKLNEELAKDRELAETEDGKLQTLVESAADLRQKRNAAAKQLDAAARATDKLAQQFEHAQSELQRNGEACQTHLQRYEEDYQIDLESLKTADRIQDPQLLADLSNEAARLRQDISSVGEINTAALAELDELQQRYDHLNSQYEDLQSAKESLQRIIHKINGDSRRVFLETLEIIRQNFQKLYRKSFGGGHADIVLESGADVLECGIDIIATPPGKTAFSNSLLSGGEKALTAVALLLAIFQYRPSPFCVLDEVDAPFDEANIGRFVSVLNEFLDWTKFIVVTHSKKTMTAATTLYGVTMQESGVSKQVAVRFEDVNDKGEIRNMGSHQRKAA